MSAKLPSIRNTLWKRLSGPGGLDLEKDLVRKGRVGAFLDHWITTLESPQLLAEKGRMELLHNTSPSEEKNFLVEKYPGMASEWEFFFNNPGEEKLQKAGERQIWAQWSKLWEDDRSTHLWKSALESYGTLREEIFSRLKSLEDTEKRVKSLFGPRDLGWDLESGAWMDSQMETLWDLVDVLHKRPDIEQLSRLLGRKKKSRTPEVDTGRAEESQYYEEGVLQPGRTEIHGLKRGAGLGELIPQELALLAQPETAEIFWNRWAQGTLLGWDYGTRQPQVNKRSPQGDGTENLPGGPLVICLDTSGSMRGKPEKIAKTLVLALLRETIKEQRPLYLINYSVELKAMELGALEKNFAQFLGFLGYSFHGGTDLNPALGHALGLLEGGKWKDADVLVISDFSQPKIRPEVVKKMKEVQFHGGHSYYYVSISAKTIRDQLNIFDGGWVYNTGLKSAEGIPLEALNKLPE